MNTVRVSNLKLNLEALMHGHTLKIQKTHPNAKFTRAHEDDAGLDLYTVEDFELEPNERFKVDLGIAVALPPGTVGLVFPRSGLSLEEGITLANSVGVIDAGFRGELKAAVHNIGSYAYVPAGTRIVQMLVQPVIVPALEVVDDLDGTARGDAGFGSSGGYEKITAEKIWSE